LPTKTSRIELETAMFFEPGGCSEKRASQATGGAAMAGAASRLARGHISIVEDECFTLVTDDGQGYRFTLAPNANIGAAELPRLCTERAHVVIRFEGDPTLDAAIAQVLLLAHTG
jgi:hypothetical protein